MQRSAGVVDEPDFVHSDWRTIRVEHKQTVGSTLLLLTLDDSVALERPARHPGARAVFGTKLGERHGLTTEVRRDIKKKSDTLANMHCGGRGKLRLIQCHSVPRTVRNGAHLRRSSLDKVCRDNPPLECSVCLNELQVCVRMRMRSTASRP